MSTQKRLYYRERQNNLWRFSQWKQPDETNSIILDGSILHITVPKLIDNWKEISGNVRGVSSDEIYAFIFSGESLFSTQQVHELLICQISLSELGVAKQRFLIASNINKIVKYAGDFINTQALCRVLRYYNNSTQSPRASSQPQTLDFRNQRWDSSGMPATIPQELWDMRIEDNRLKSFKLPHATFTALHVVSVEDLAADGFYYLQETDRVKCAFCKGVLKDWDPGEVVREAHRRHFSTCPFVLNVDVGNVPKQDRYGDVRMVAEQCTECSDAADVEIVNGDWNQMFVQDLPPTELGEMTAAAMSSNPKSHSRFNSAPSELLSLELMKRPRLPVPMESAKSACSKTALTNLSALQNRFNLELESSGVPAKYPHFTSYSARLESIHLSLVQQPAYILAKAGFFYSTESRVMLCFSCGLQFSHWTCDDNVWVEHARWSPRCPHVLLERGCEFVQTVHRHLPPVLPSVSFTVAGRTQHSHASTSSMALQTSAAAARSVDMASRTPNIDEALAMSPGVEFRVDARDIKARADLPVVRLLTQLGFSALQVRLFTELRLKLSGDDFASWELFLDYMLNESRRMRDLSLDPEAFFQARMAEIARSLESQPRTRESIDWKTCKVCMDKEVNIMLLDCKHVACCSVCAKSLKTCPICRAFIRGTFIIHS